MVQMGGLLQKKILDNGCRRVLMTNMEERDRMCEHMTEILLSY